MQRSLLALGRACLAVTLCLSLGGAACQPEGVHTDPPPGPANFVLYRSGEPVWSRTFTPGPTLAFGPDDIWPASGFAMDNPAFPVSATLTVPDAEVARPLEAQLFVRDPQETLDTLRSITDPHDFFLQVITPDLAMHGANYGNATLPSAMVMAVPLAQLPSDQTPTSDHVDPLHTVHFGIFPQEDPPLGAAVQSVRFVQNGLCARTVPYSEIVQPISHDLPAQLQGVCPHVSTFRLQALTLASYLTHHEVDPAIGPSNPFDAGGGFAVNGSAWVELNPFGSCQLEFDAFYDLGLLDGIARVSLEDGWPHVVGDGGGACSDVSIPVFPFLSPTVHGAVSETGQALASAGESANERIRRLQSFSLAQYLPTATWQCDPSASDPASVDDGCDAARAELAAGIAAGGEAAGLTPSEIAMLQEAANAVDSGGRHHQWSCEPTDASDPTRGQCSFAIRARRLIVNPDDVRLVWFDNWEDYTSPTLALYYFISQYGGDVSRRGLDALCTPQSTPVTAVPQSHYQREFFVQQLSPFECTS